MSPIGYDDLHDVEIRVTNAETGGQKGSKLTQLGALDPIALIYLARVAGYGAEKYDAFNFLKGYDWSLTQNAGQRHNLLFWSGEDIDEESGLPHPALEAWHALTKLSFFLRGLGRDDRPPRLASQVEGMMSPEDAMRALGLDLGILPGQFRTAETRHEDLLWRSATDGTEGGDVLPDDYAPVAESPIDAPPCGDHLLGDVPECCGGLSPAMGLL